MNKPDPLQPSESSLSNQSVMGQPPLPSQPPTTNPLQPFQSPTTNPPLLHQPVIGQPQLRLQSPTTNPPLPGHPTVSQPLPPPPPGVWPPQYQAPIVQQPPQPEQSTVVRQSLRQRYTEEQIRLYFFPYPDRTSKIGVLRQKHRKLMQQILALVLAGLFLFVLFIVFAGQGIVYLGFLALAGIIGSIVLITRLVKNQLHPLNRELARELANDKREKDHTYRVRPPDERQYDEWLDEISDEIYNQAPARLHLQEHPAHIKWRQAIDGNSLMPSLKEPEEYGASLFLEGELDASSLREGEALVQFSRRTSLNSLRGVHYTIYVFTALFITEDYIATYTSIIDLCDARQDREEFEYGYHQHLSHMSLKVNTISHRINMSQPELFSFKESTLLLTFDSGHAIKRNISTLHVGNNTVTKIDRIHQELTRALIDHERSLPRSLRDDKRLA